MDCIWNQLRDAMQRQLAERSSQVAFNRAQQFHLALRSHPGAEELVAALHSRRLAPAAADELLRALIRCVRQPEFREMATAAVWVALWPGLCSMLGRLIRRGLQRDEAIADVQLWMTTKLDEFNLDLPRPLVKSLLDAIELTISRKARSELGIL